MCTDTVKSDDPDQYMNYIHLWKSFNLLNASNLYKCVTNLNCLAMPVNET